MRTVFLEDHFVSSRKRLKSYPLVSVLNKFTNGIRDSVLHEWIKCFFLWRFSPKIQKTSVVGFLVRIAIQNCPFVVVIVILVVSVVNISHFVFVIVVPAAFFFFCSASMRIIIDLSSSIFLELRWIFQFLLVEPHLFLWWVGHIHFPKDPYRRRHGQTEEGRMTPTIPTSLRPGSRHSPTFCRMLCDPNVFFIAFDFNLKLMPKIKKKQITMRKVWIIIQSFLSRRPNHHTIYI